MTRVLSELLGAHEPMFRMSLNQLEQASGRPSNDIRLTSDTLQATQVKLRQLGLDGRDTTGPELYEALKQRTKLDDERLAKALKATSKTDDLVANVAHALKSVPIPSDCFALKTTALKRLLKKVPPKRAMKQLGYRSLDSVLKHEPAACLLAAGQLVESATWHKNVIDQYKHLRPSDFEVRKIEVINPTSKRWQSLAEEVVREKKHNVVGLKELGAIVLLPLPAEHPPAVTITTLLLSLHAWNEIRACSTFLKLCQVKPDFGAIVQTVATGEPYLPAKMLDQPVPWQLIQRYYARFKNAFKEEVFEPHIQPSDLTWHSIEKVLTHLEPSLDFWRHTNHLALLHDGEPVSLNVIDAALNYCNQLPYENRIVHYFRDSLWHELLLGYFKHERVEQTVLGQLQTELVTEPALI